MHEIYELKDMLCKELEEYGAKGEMTAGSLDVVDKLAHTIKNLDKIIEAYEEEEYSGEMGSHEGGMSYERGGNRGGNRSPNRGSYRYEGSYARNGRRGGNNPTGRNQYSRERGYSRADGMEDMVESIRGMMGELPQEVQRDAQRFVQKLEQMM